MPGTCSAHGNGGNDYDTDSNNDGTIEKMMTLIGIMQMVAILVKDEETCTWQ